MHGRRATDAESGRRRMSATPSPFDSSGASVVRILLIEDDADFASIVRHRLDASTGLAVRVDWVQTLREALARLERHPADLVLADLGLPDSAGLATLERLRSAGERLIVVLTGLADPALHEAALAQGAYDVVHKDRLDGVGLERLVRLAALQARTVRSLQKSEERFRKLTELSADWYWEQDDQFRFTLISGPRAAANARGGDPSVYLGMRRWEDRGLEPVEGDWAAHIATLQRHEPFRDLRLRRRMDDGTLRYMSVSGEPVYDEDGRFAGYRGVATDITDRVRAEEQSREAAAVLRLIADNVPAMIAYYDREVRLRYANRRHAEFYGYALEDKLGRHMREVIGEQAWAEVRPYFERAYAGESLSYERAVPRADGAPVHIHVDFVPQRSEGGEIEGLYVLVTDVTERVRQQEQLERQANYDALTGLPNRNLLRDRLTQAIHKAARSGQSLAVLFIDLDRLKRINDTLGHAMGDRVIALVGERIAAAVRRGDTVARIGGDEFVALLPDLQRDDDAATVAAKLRAAIGAPLQLDAHEFVLSASIGIALHPRDGVDAATLLKHADAALYRAKEEGRDCIRFFSPEINARIARHMAMERALRNALEAGEFRLLYQPVVRLRDGAVVGAEALIRWRRADGTVHAPGEFVPVAEESGLIVPIGRWVLETAARQARAWELAGRRRFHVSVNLSARQFRDPELLASIRAAFRAAKADPGRVQLEITEDTLMRDQKEAMRILRALRRFGTRIALDDFGTGCSSLADLKRLPIDALKIDRRFVRGVARDAADLAIARAAIRLAEGLGLDVVAEGVESRAQAEVLAREGCRFAQGYWFGRPVAAEAIAARGATRAPNRRRRR